jgi:hypothetical protein
MVLIALVVQSIASMIFWSSDRELVIILGMLIGGFGCAWTWAMSQAGGIATVPLNKVGLASGTMLTVMVTVGNMGIVVSATFLSSMSGSGQANNAPGIQASYVLAAVVVLVGFAATWIMVPRDDATAAA